MIRLNFVAFGNHSGYSQLAQDTMLALHNSGKYDVRVQWMMANAVKRSGMSEQRTALFEEMAEKDNVDRIQVYCCIPNAQRHVKPLKKNISYAMFETFEPPNTGHFNNWISIINRSDALISPSNFNVRIFAHEKIKKPIHLVPPCVDFEAYHRGVEPLKKYDRFTFLFFGSWRLRKGYPQLLEAWFRTFSVNDGVQLVIKTDKPQRAKAYVNNMKANMGFVKKDHAPILFESDVLDEQDLPRLFKSADCLISPTLGEGIGLPAIQCMSLGVPVAITKFSGCEDYASEDTCTVIGHNGFRLYPCLDDIPQFRNRKWANVEAKEVSRVLRQVKDNQVEIRDKAETAYDFVRENFSYEKAEKAFTRMINEIYSSSEMVR